MLSFDSWSLPRRCFISHSYKDNALVAKLIRRLPRRVEPYIFPPIEVSPDRRVSDDLVAAILECPGLIYIESENARNSVWVSFERDFAIRAKKPVFSFNAGKIRIDRSAPLDLNVYPIYSPRDRDRVGEVMSFMRTRHFDVFNDSNMLMAGDDLIGTMRSEMESAIQRNGYFVAFVSNAMLQSAVGWRGVSFVQERAPDRFLPVLLDDQVELTDEQFNRYQSVKIARSDGRGFNWNRVDDLIVRIYDLTFRRSTADAA